MVQHYPTVCRDLGSIPRTTEKHRKLTAPDLPRPQFEPQHYKSKIEEKAASPECWRKSFHLFGLHFSYVQNQEMTSH